MSAEVEDVAKTLWEGFHLGRWPAKVAAVDFGLVDPESFRDAAKLILKNLESPSDRMVRAGVVQFGWSPEKVEVVFREMMREALR